MKLATATTVETGIEQPASILSKLIYPASLLASLSIWLLALRAPLWLDETLAYWQVSGGFWKIWSRSQLMPSSIGYLYTLWAAKSILGSREIALKIPSTLAMLGAVYFLFRSARELFDQDIAFLVCVFFCLEPNVVFAATDARPYAFALLATNVAIFAFIVWVTRHQMHQAMLFGAAAAGILYFHYLFGAILPAFAIYYLAVRRGSIRADARQLAAVLTSFTLLALPLIVRVLSLYNTRNTHVVQELPPKWVALNTLMPMQTLIGFGATAFLAALVRKLKLPGRDCFPAIVLCPLLALVPAGILYGLSAATSLHLVIPRYFLVVAPGSALTWGLLTSRIDSRLLRQIFCVSLVAVTVFECFSSPNSRRHELSFKPAHDFVNANVAKDKDKVPVLTCSAFIESDFEPLPTDLNSENALASQLSYYPINAPVVLLPFSLNDEAIRIGSQTVLAAAQQRQRFLAVGTPECYPTLRWIAGSASGAFTAQPIGDFNGIVVVEFRPVAGRD
ncbi:MAG TPA: glycosyltransferase family 39 protein [Terriglobales bacterium]|nr:glycosyltransferase family 39 protein [Terriglobales bacterium]